MANVTTTTTEVPVFDRENTKDQTFTAPPPDLVGFDDRWRREMEVNFERRQRFGVMAIPRGVDFHQNEHFGRVEFDRIDLDYATSDEIRDAFNRYVDSVHGWPPDEPLWDAAFQAARERENPGLRPAYTTFRAFDFEPARRMLQQSADPVKLWKDDSEVHDEATERLLDHITKRKFLGLPVKLERDELHQAFIAALELTPLMGKEKTTRTDFRQFDKQLVDRWGLPWGLVDIISKAACKSRNPHKQTKNILTKMKPGIEMEPNATGLAMCARSKGRYNQRATQDLGGAVEEFFELADSGGVVPYHTFYGKRGAPETATGALMGTMNADRHAATNYGMVGTATRAIFFPGGTTMCGNIFSGTTTVSGGNLDALRYTAVQGTVEP